MFVRGKLVTSLLRAAALVAGAVTLAPFCTFADSALAPAAIPFTVTPGTTPLLFEGGAAGIFVLTVENISPVPIVVRSLTVAITARGGLDSSDTLAGVPVTTKNDCGLILAPPKVLAVGGECTITFAVKPVGNGPETEVPVDFGLTQVEFTVSALTPTETSRPALADFRVEDVPVPEPATLILFATGVLV